MTGINPYKDPLKTDLRLTALTNNCDSGLEANSAFVRMQQDGFSNTKIILPPLRSVLRSELTKSNRFKMYIMQR